MIQFSAIGKVLPVMTAVAVVALGAGPAVANDGEWTRVVLTPEGETSSDIVSTDGAGVAAGYSKTEKEGNATGRIWEDGKLLRSGEPGEIFHDINKKGVIAGAASGEAVLWDEEGAKTPLQAPPNSGSCQANAVNDSGDVAGICFEGRGNIRAVRWQAPDHKPEVLDTPEDKPRAYRIVLDNDGNIASSLGPDGEIFEQHPVVWNKAGELTELERPNEKTGALITGLAHGQVFGAPMPLSGSGTKDFAAILEDAKAGLPLSPPTTDLPADAASAPSWDVTTGKLINHDLEDVDVVDTVNAHGVFAGCDQAERIRLWKDGKTFARLPESDGAHALLVNDAADAVFGSTGGGLAEGHAMQWFLK